MRSEILLALALFLAAPACLAADAQPAVSVSATVKAGGLSCFTIVPLLTPKEPSSCDELCAAQGAACSGVQTGGGVSPPPNCASTFTGPIYTSCRCCKVE